jgi:hypothetical protein
MLLRHQHDSDAHGQTEPDQTNDPDETEPAHSAAGSPGRFDKLSEHRGDQATIPEPVEGRFDKLSERRDAEPGSPGRFEKLSGPQDAEPGSPGRFDKLSERQRETQPTRPELVEGPIDRPGEPGTPGRFDKLSEHQSDQPTSPEPVEGPIDRPGEPGTPGRFDKLSERQSDQPTRPEPVEGPIDRPGEPGTPGRFDKLSEHAGLGERSLRAGRPQVTIHFHLSQEAVAAGAGVVRMEGVGPIPLDHLRRFLTRTGCQITVRPVIDLNDQPAPVDSYEIPNRLREHLRHRSPASAFPYSPNTSRRRDLDHTISYLPPSRGGPPGQTSVGNLGPLTRSEHRHKTFGRWRIRQPEPGLYLWRSPHGHVFLATNQGTLDLGNTGFAKAIWRDATKIKRIGRYTPAA